MAKGADNESLHCAAQATGASFPHVPHASTTVSEDLSAVKDLYPWMVRVRRTLHQTPELAYEEEQTAAIVMDELRGLNIPFEYGGKGRGVVARVAGSDPSCRRPAGRVGRSAGA